MKSTNLKAYVKTLPVIRSFGKSSPVYHIGGIWENRLGLQAGRVICKNLAWRMRGSAISENTRTHVETLQRDGILVIRNFLSKDAFERVSDEYREAVEAVELKPYKGIKNAKLFRTQVSIGENPEEYPQIAESFLNNEFLKDIARGVIRRKVIRNPAISFDKYQCIKKDGIDNDIENILHADLHTPTVKMFFYLNAADEKNGAFVYAKASHRLTFARVAHEYEMSIRQAKLKNRLPVDTKLVENRGDEIRNIVAPGFYKRMKIEETQVCVEPNTLVVANNMGFHRRGEFLNGTPRKALLINFRNSERLFI